MTEAYYYSAENNAFYAVSMKEDYEQAESWPSDAIQISTIWYQRLLQGQAKGMLITPNDQGEPTLRNPPEKTKAEEVEEADLMKASLIQDELAKISVIQLKVQIGRKLSAEETALLNETLDYIDKVNAIDTTKAPNIDWPPVPVSE